MRKVEMQWDLATPADMPSNAHFMGDHRASQEEVMDLVNDALKAKGLEFVEVDGLGIDYGIYALVELGKDAILVSEPHDERPYWWRNDPDGPAAKCDDDAALLAYAQDGGWVNQANFEAVTGTTFAELKGKWFTIVHDAVHISENQS